MNSRTAMSSTSWLKAVWSTWLPATVIRLKSWDLSFAVQALAAKYILEHHAELGNHVYVLPHEIDTEIAKIKLASMGYAIDTLSEEQRKYLNLD